MGKFSRGVWLAEVAKVCPVFSKWQTVDQPVVDEEGAEGLAGEAAAGVVEVAGGAGEEGNRRRKR